MAEGGGDKTEKATPKRREEARKEGQVARSMEVNSALAILAGFGVLLLWGPQVWKSMSAEMVHFLGDGAGQGAGHHALSPRIAMEMFFHVVKVMLVTTGPFLLVMAVVGVGASVLQVKFKVTPQVIKPRLSKINPINGFKQKFSPASLVELAKNVVKMVVVGAPAALTLWQNRDDLMALGAAEPLVAGKLTARLIIEIGFKVAAVYIVIAIADYIWQRHRYEKQIRMTKQEVKQEMRQQDMAPELKAQQRRRQREAARRRMLADVPTADVIITNPTHYSIALRYDPDLGAPQVVAKGVDLLALRIREIAEEHGVMRVENRPLARELYGAVEVGQVIPAELFTAVAEVLAFVYRTNSRRRDDWTQPRRALEHA